MSETASIILTVAIVLFVFLIMAGLNIFLFLTFKKRSAPTQDPPTQPRSDYGFPPGSIGDVSSRIGYDVRDVLMAGFTHQEIREFTKEEILSVMHGEYSLQELRKRKKK